jgi:hypothetical protein
MLLPLLLLAVVVFVVFVGHVAVPSQHAIQDNQQTEQNKTKPNQRTRSKVIWIRWSSMSTLATLPSYSPTNHNRRQVWLSLKTFARSAIITKSNNHEPTENNTSRCEFARQINHSLSERQGHQGEAHHEIPFSRRAERQRR